MRKRTKLNSLRVIGDRIILASKINGVTVLEGNKAIDVSELNNVFSGKGISSAELRKSAFDRKK